MSMSVAKRARAQAKGKLTQFVKSIDSLLQLPFEEVSQERCKYVISETEVLLNQYDMKQSALEVLVEEDDMLEEIKEASGHRTEVVEKLIKAKELLGKVSERSKNVSSHSKSSDEVKKQSVSLPKLRLPIFEGDILQFQEFWDKFTTVIDSREDISVVDKFSYLQSLLKGSASACLQGLALTSVNYDTAKELLNQRFGRTEKVIIAHIQKLLNISSAKSSLWEIHDQVQIQVRSLANLGVKGDKYGMVLTPIIVHQLPQAVRLEWARISDKKEGDVDHLLEFLKQEILTRERSAQFVKSAEDRNPEKRGGGNRSTASGLVAPAEGKTVSSFKKQCSFCRQQHFSDKCPDIKDLSVDQRKEKVKAMRLCFRCLSSQHLANACNRKCFVCKGFHHSVLHRQKQSPQHQANQGPMAGPQHPPVNFIAPCQGNSAPPTGMQFVPVPYYATAPQQSYQTSV